MSEGGWSTLSDSEKIYMPILSVCMLAVSGTMSGLTVATFSIDLTRLKVAARAKPIGDAEYVLRSLREKQRAAKLLPLLRRGHLTLVTLLVTNTMAMIALPIFLDKIFGPAIALIISVTALLFLGEVLPQAVFVRHNVAICAFCAPLVWVAIFLTGIVSYPFSVLLDCAIHDTSERMNRQRLLEIIADVEAAHREQQVTGANGQVLHVSSHAATPHEIRLMRGALALTERRVSSLPIVEAASSYMLSTADALTPALIEKLLKEGYSRVPVFLGTNRSQIVGCLIVKSLIALVFSKTVDAASEPPRRGESTDRLADVRFELSTNDTAPWTPGSGPASPITATPSVLARDPSASGLGREPSFSDVQRNAPLRVGELYLREPVRVSGDTTVEDLYKAFRMGQSHIACVYDRLGALHGFVTLDDVLETLHGVDYQDEDDVDDSMVPASSLPEAPSGVLPRRSTTGTGMARGSTASGLGSASRDKREKRLMTVYASTRRSVAEGLTIMQPGAETSLNRTGRTPNEPRQVRPGDRTASFDAPEASPTTPPPPETRVTAAGPPEEGPGVSSSPKDTRASVNAFSPTEGE